MTEVSLSSLLLPQKVVTIDFPGFTGLSFDLCFLSRVELSNLRKKCVNTKYSQRTRTPEETLDEQKFLVEYSEAVIKGWKGFKFKYVKEFLLVDIGDLDSDSEMPYTVENAKTLIEESSIFDDWLTETVGNLENFTQNS